MVRVEIAEHGKADHDGRGRNRRTRKSRIMMSRVEKAEHGKADHYVKGGNRGAWKRQIMMTRWKSKIIPWDTILPYKICIESVGDQIKKTSRTFITFN